MSGKKSIQRNLTPYDLPSKNVRSLVPLTPKQSKLPTMHTSYLTFASINYKHSVCTTYILTTMFPVNDAMFA